MLSVLLRRDVALLSVGGLISGLGDWLLIIAFPFYVYQVTGSTLATGAMFLAPALARLTIGPWAGVFVDRWDRRRTMILWDLARAALLLPLLTIHSADSIWIVYPISVSLTACSQFFGPARRALIPHLVERNDLTAANSLDAMSSQLAMLFGAPIGGVLLGWFGLGSVAVLDATSFVASAASIALIAGSAGRRSGAEEPETEPGGRLITTAPAWSGAIARALAEWRDGLRVVRDDRALVAIFATEGTSSLGQGIINVLWIVYLRDVLRGGPLDYGVVQTAVGTGAVVGGILVGRVSKLASPRLLIGLGATTVGALLLATFNVPVLDGAIVFNLLGGAPAMVWAVTADTLLQTEVSDAFRGRVFGAYGTTQSVLSAVGMGLASMLGGSVGVVPLLDVAGSLFVVAGVLGLAMLREDRLPRGLTPVDGDGLAVDQ